MNIEYLVKNVFLSCRIIHYCLGFEITWFLDSNSKKNSADLPLINEVYETILNLKQFIRVRIEDIPQKIFSCQDEAMGGYLMDIIFPKRTMSSKTPYSCIFPSKTKIHIWSNIVSRLLCTPLGFFPSTCKITVKYCENYAFEPVYLDLSKASLVFQHFIFLLVYSPTFWPIFCLFDSGHMITSIGVRIVYCGYICLLVWKWVTCKWSENSHLCCFLSSCLRWCEIMPIFKTKKEKKITFHW